MDFFSRFCGTVTPAAGRLTAAPPEPRPLSFQLLFADRPELSADALTAALRDYHPELAAAAAELVPVAGLPAGAEVVSPDGPPAAVVGLAGWGRHVVKLVGFDAPMPAHAIQGCLDAALMPPEMKADARKHQAHVLLYYAGFAGDVLERYVALGAVAGALTRFGASVTLNEEARACIPAFALLPDDPGEDMLQVLRTLPVPYLYGGFVKMELSDTPGVWVRTFACPRLGLPNLAYHAAGHHEGQRLFRLFAAMLGYLRETGLRFEAGEVVRVDEATHLRLREPTEAEWWLDSDGPLFVAEPVE